MNEISEFARSGFVTSWIDTMDDGILDQQKKMKESIQRCSVPSTHFEHQYTAARMRSLREVKDFVNNSATPRGHKSNAREFGNLAQLRLKEGRMGDKISIFLSLSLQ
jgi:hypothetical protein